MPDNDHDLLISVANDVKHIVDRFTKLESTVEGIALAMPLAAETTNTKLNAKVDWGKFWGITILLVGLAVGTMGYNFKMDKDAHAAALRCETKIDLLHKGDKRNVDSNIRTGR